MNDATITLWGAGTSRTHRTLWFATEMGISYEHRPIQPRTGETKAEEYLAINPRHKVPALVHGNVTLTESAAILNYLNEAFDAPDGIFVAQTPLERSRLLSWCFFAMTELDAIGIYSIRRHEDLAEIYGASPIAAASGREYFAYQLSRMERTIRATGEFLMGGAFSIADVLLKTNLDAARHYQIELSPFYSEWSDRIGARGAYRETFKANYPGRVGAKGA